MKKIIYTNILIIFFSCISSEIAEAQSNMEVEIKENEVIYSTSSIFGMRGDRRYVLKPEDINSYQHLGGYYSKDKFNVYYRHLRLENVDVKSFNSLINSEEFPELNLFPAFKRAIGIDTSNIYFLPNTGYYFDSINAEKIFSRKDFEILKVLDSVKCAYFVKYGEEFYELSGDMYLRPGINKYEFLAKGNTFLGGRFVRNGNKVYNGSLEVKVANLNKFKVYGDSYYYFNGEDISYLQDYSEEIIEGVDIASFEIHPIVDCIARDKNHYYFDGVIIDWSDMSKIVNLFSNSISIEEMLRLKYYYNR